jgi:hypothetical protein
MGWQCPFSCTPSKQWSKNYIFTARNDYNVNLGVLGCKRKSSLDPRNNRLFNQGSSWALSTGSVNRISKTSCTTTNWPRLDSLSLVGPSLAQAKSDWFNEISNTIVLPRYALPAYLGFLSCWRHSHLQKDIGFRGNTDKKKNICCKPVHMARGRNWGYMW